MGFLDDLNNAQENKIKREIEEKRKTEAEIQKRLEECVKTLYTRDLKPRMLDQAEHGKKYLKESFRFYSLAMYRTIIEEDDREPKDAGQWITKKYGIKNKSTYAGRAVYVYLPLFSLEIMRKMETILTNYLEEDGLINFSIKEDEYCYANENGTWDDRQEAPSSARLVYEPSVNIEISW